jgi:hypothetical protein
MQAPDRNRAAMNRPGNPYYRGAKSDHFDGEIFFNPGGIAPRSFADLLRWQFGGGKAKWPASWPSPFPPAKPAERITGDALRLTMVGHASVLIQTAGLNILVDPVWSERVSPYSFIGPRRVNAPGIAFEVRSLIQLGTARFYTYKEGVVASDGSFAFIIYKVG